MARQMAARLHGSRAYQVRGSVFLDRLSMHRWTDTSVFPHEFYGISTGLGSTQVV
jgi:hypothetical protein